MIKQSQQAQLQLPCMPKPRGRVFFGREKSDVDKIVEHYETVRGKFIFGSERNQARKHARQILDAGYTVEEVCGAIDWLDGHELYGALSEWSLVFVGKRIAGYRRLQVDGAGALGEIVQAPADWK